MALAEQFGNWWNSGKGLFEGFNNSIFNPIDFVLPGTSILNTLFDPTGKNAAAAQFDSQLALQHDQQVFNSAEAEKDRAFQQYNADTQYQRAAADINAAGLNPWILAGGGQTAAAASGSTATSGQGSASMANNKMLALAGLALAALTKGSSAKATASKVGGAKVINNYFGSR